MSREQIIELLGEDWNELNQTIRSVLRSDVDLLQRINEGILSHRGKLLRPIISLLMAKSIDSIGRDSLKFAAACELLHNATLMHDDVADESAKRRGSPTLGALFGPSAAVLVGDFWLAKAVELILDCKSYSNAVGFFAKTLTDLAEGEMLQLEKAASADTSEEDYIRIIRCKTASLFEAAALSGAVSVGADEEQKEAARLYAESYGIAFQIKDDILDYLGTDELGKPVGVDLKEQKITLPLLGALRDSPREQEIREKLRNIRENPGYCEEIRDFVLSGDGMDYANSRLEDFISSAISALDVFPDSEAKEALKEIALYNRFRNV